MNMNPRKFSYSSMGTSWEITIWDFIEDSFFEKIEREVVAMSEDFDQTYSRFIKTSLVWKIAEKAGKYGIPEDFINMLQLYFDLYEPSNKKLNPLVGFTISDLGYDDQYSLVVKDIIRPTPDLLETVKIIQKSDEANGMAMGAQDHTMTYEIETTEPVLLDFGALGKGYFVDKISNYLKQQNLNHFLVNGSGDIYYSGGPASNIPIKVGLEHPNDPKLVIGTVEMTDGSMCASGINRRTWDKYHHVIDPHSKKSTGNEIVATWVIADSAALADALASCLFFVEPEALSKYNFQYVIMNNENKIKKSPLWKGEIFS